MFKISRVRRLLSIVLTGVLVLFITACGSATVGGAQPENPPVQMGGNNNSYKTGDNSHTGMKAKSYPKDSAALGNERASAFSRSQSNLVAYAQQDNESKLLYPETGVNNEEVYKINPEKVEASIQEAQQLPKQRQYIVDRSDPDAKILERSVQAFKDASEFLNNRQS